MPTLPPAVAQGIDPPEAHRARPVAESFGVDPERYDRTRPRYPEALAKRIMAASPGPEILDVGCGTGIAARQFQALGALVLGVEPDSRMADFARGTGVATEVAAFEDWDSAGRHFDAVIAGQAWHWVDPVAGAAKAAQVLRPGGRIALFWYVFQPPPDLADAFAAVYHRAVPNSPFSRPGDRRPVLPTLEAYSAFFTRAADGIGRAGAFSAPEQWRFDWDRRYTRGEWLDQVPTFGGHSLIPAVQQAELLAGLGAVIDAAGGSFPTHFTAVAVTATRSPARTE
jgi:SAM-dependent methyltransferase